MRFPRWGDRRLALKLAGLIFLLVSAVIGGITAYLILHERREHEEELQHRGVLIATQMAQQSVDPILREDDYALFKLVQVVARNRGRDLTGEEIITYATVVDSEGIVLAHRGPAGLPPPAGPGRDRADPPPAPRVRPGRGPDGERLYDVTVPVMMRGVPIGGIRLGLSREALDRRLAETALKVLGTLFAAMLLGVGVILRFSRGLAGPILRLRDAARRVQGGDLTARVEVRREDEIGELAEAFNRMTEALERSQAELRREEAMRSQLLQQVITAQEDERRRIARELHDETSQSLTSLMVGLRMLEGSVGNGARGAIAEMRRTVSQTLEAVRDLSLQLRPSVLDDLGLVPALERCVADFPRKYGIRAEFQASLPGGLRLAQAVETSLYSIAQEALTNVARHAEATQVEVLLEQRGGRVILIVEDDGRGFESGVFLGPGRDERRLGLFGMRERATLVGGTFTVESRPGAGTTIYVEVPTKDGDRGASQ